VPRTKPLPKPPTRSKVHTVLPGELHEQVRLYCSHHGISECEFFRRATLEKLADAGDAKQLTRALKAQRRTGLDTQFQSEFNTQLLSAMLLLFGSSIASLPKEERAANERQARALQKAVIDRAMQDMSAGNTLIAKLRELLLIAQPAEPTSASPAGSGRVRQGPPTAP
jgi:hypothetical protein